jgi:voltage-gated potassium channel Kch
VPDQRRAAALGAAIFAPYDKSAALLLWGALGLIVILVLETVACMAVLGQGVVDAAYGSAKTLVTVDPNDEVADGPKGLKLFLTVSMLTALVFEASFTAGLVNRLVNKRLTGLVGRRAVPRRDHVVVVGMGQVGLRLCLLLRACGIGIVAVDDREEGENVGFAREFGFPVVIGRGADPSLLRRLSLQRACALAAVTDDDLENISIAMAARSVNPDLRVVMRAGDGRVANETRSLFRIGLVRDVHRIAAVLIAARATGSEATRVVCIEHEAHLLFEDGRLEEAAVPAAN